MKQFEYTITEPVGIHARPASILVKKAVSYESTVILGKNGKTTDAKRLMALMALGIKCGDKVIFTIEGKDEEAAACDLEEFCKNNL